MSGPATVRRFVVTIAGRDGLRTLFDPAQGRFTYATREEAYDRLTAFARESRDRIDDLYGVGACTSMRVSECECWAGHFDPVGVYFDDEPDKCRQRPEGADIPDTPCPCRAGPTPPIACLEHVAKGGGS